MRSNSKKITVGVNVLANEKCANLDYKYGPYNSVSEAFTTLGSDNLDVLAVGLTVGIIENNKVIEYWFESACATETDLVRKVTCPAPIDNLTSTSTILPLSARQGKVLKDSLDGIVAIPDSTINELN